MDVTRTGITTKFRGPTARLGARIIAQCKAGSCKPMRFTLDYNHALTSLDNHVIAAHSLCATFGIDWLDGGRVVSVWDTVHDSYLHCVLFATEVTE